MKIEIKETSIHGRKEHPLKKTVEMKVEKSGPGNGVRRKT